MLLLLLMMQTLSSFCCRTSSIKALKGMAHLQNPTIGACYSHTHQPSLAVHPGAHLQIGSPDVPIHPRHFTYLPTAVFHPCRRLHIETTAAVYSFHRLEVPPVRLCTVGKAESGRSQLPAPTRGTIFRSTSHPQSYSRFSGSLSIKTFLFSRSYPINYHNYYFFFLAFPMDRAVQQLTLFRPR